MKKQELQAFTDEFDRLPNAGEATYTLSDGTELRAAHVGNIVTLSVTSLVDTQTVEQLNKLLHDEYFVELANTSVGFWELRAEAA